MGRRNRLVKVGFRVGKARLLRVKGAREGHHSNLDAKLELNRAVFDGQGLATGGL